MDEIGFLEQMVSIPSLSGQEDAVARFLIEQMTALGFRAHRDGAGNVLGTIGDPHAAREIVLLGHMDTVPGQVHVRQRDGRLYGRGAVDAKGPLAAFVLAAVRAASQLKNARAVVIGVVEEEGHGKGARHLAHVLPPPDCVIIGEPSGWQGVTVGYKGRVCVDYRWMQPGSHSAGERPGPAEKAVTFWNQVMTYAEEYNGGRANRFDTLDPALRDFRTFGARLHEGVEMNVALRLPPGFNLGVLKHKMAEWSAGAQLTYSPSDPPYQAEKNTPLVRALLKAIRAHGGEPRFKLKTGTSDMNTVGPAWGCPIVAYGPGDSSLDHTPEEHIEIEEFQRGIDVLARALEILGE
jgi:LysW-gamma-L-lysine carboxypeptidase